MQKNKFEILQMAPEFTNSVLVSNGADCVIFDAWGRAEDWIKLLDARKLKPLAIYATHGHSDHISAAPALAAHYNIPWFMNALDVPLVLWGNQILDFWELPRIPDDFVRPHELNPGRLNILDNIDMDVIAAPGHSLGGVMFYFPEYKILLTGDTIFREGVGRTDLPGGDEKQLNESLAKLGQLNLPDDTYIVHGHGPDSMMCDIKNRLQ